MLLLVFRSDPQYRTGALGNPASLPFLGAQMIRRLSLPGIFAVLPLLILVSTAWLQQSEPSTTILVSASTNGSPGDLQSRHPALSASGRFVAFESNASNFIPGDVGGMFGDADVFVKDIVTNVLEPISVTSDGEKGNAGSGWPDITDDGRYVAFNSDASNLVPDDTNSNPDIFLFDRYSGTMSLISLAYDGSQLGGATYGADTFALSPDGRYLAFMTDSRNVVPDIPPFTGADKLYVRNLTTGEVEHITYSSIDGDWPNESSGGPDISTNGRYVTFWSLASNLVSDDLNGDGLDVFLHDRATGETTRLMPPDLEGLTDSIAYEAAISSDGRYVAFGAGGSASGNVYLYDIQDKTYSLVTEGLDGWPSNGVSQDVSISPTGRFVTFRSKASNLVPNDNNDQEDAFLYDQDTGVTELISLA